jgi:hypothetical protein
MDFGLSIDEVSTGSGSDRVIVVAIDDCVD